MSADVYHGLAGMGHREIHKDCVTATQTDKTLIFKTNLALTLIGIALLYLHLAQYNDVLFANDNTYNAMVCDIEEKY